jgi:hypothetical protein
MSAVDQLSASRCRGPLAPGRGRTRVWSDHASAASRPPAHCPRTPRVPERCRDTRSTRRHERDSSREALLDAVVTRLRSLLMRKSSIIWAHACGAFKESTTGVARRLLVRAWAKTSAFGLHQSAPGVLAPVLRSRPLCIGCEPTRALGASASAIKASTVSERPCRFGRSVSPAGALPATAAA